jgi:hypothetical protein
MTIRTHAQRAALAAACTLFFAGVTFAQSATSDDLYENARRLIDDGRFSEAVDRLDQMLAKVAQLNGAAAQKNRVDAALYWKAYSLSKQGELADAMTTLADIERKFAGSGWIKDAKALELEIRQASGQAVSPETQPDEELKLLALRGLMQSDPERALPMIDQILAGDSSVRVKENALFLLSQSRSARAREVITNVAKGTSNPELQLRAVRYLGVMRDDQSRQTLREVYRSTSDEGVKRAVLRGFVAGRAASELIDIARTETDRSLQRSAIRTLGTMRTSETADALRSLYASGSAEVKNDVVSALFVQQNAAALVALARAESNPEMKKEIVSKLALMKSPEATDYLMELLR